MNNNNRDVNIIGWWDGGEDDGLALRVMENE
jgi:hypothetical protein